jgi:miniconductance mechanosensitive channel
MYDLLVNELGLAPHYAALVVMLAKLIGIGVVAIVANTLARLIIERVIHRIIQKTANNWDDLLVENNVLRHASHIASAWVIFFLIQVNFPQRELMVMWIQRFALVYMIIVALMLINSLLKLIDRAYTRFQVSRQRPIKGYLQIASIIFYFLSGIFIFSVLLNKSPWGLISIFGGLTAVLLLIFKDTILGFVASIQLASNDMIAIGDWIEMPSYGADGDVIDISIHTVKVQNWDKTITTIPTYALISNSFKNWRGMQLSGGRRIKRSISIDMNTIRFCTDEMIEEFRKIHVLKPYIDAKMSELNTYNQSVPINDHMANGRRMTNVGTLRAYIVSYLKSHPKIHQQMTFLVRQLEPTDRGLPLQIYVFSNDQQWTNYEAIQSDIFDHILSVVPEFGLRVFQSPSGYDVHQLLQR